MTYWRQKVQQLALVRNPNFLNVLDVVSNGLAEYAQQLMLNGRVSCSHKWHVSPPFT
jgi:hypothetical protein